MGLIKIASPENWQYRAVERTGGNQTLMGCFMLAILGWQHGRKPPRFGKIAKILADGTVVSNMQNADGKVFPNHVLGPIQTIVDNFRGLADNLKLNDADRIEMFSELRKWFAIDLRARSDWDNVK